MKLKGLIIAAITLFTLGACNNDSSFESPRNSEGEATIKLSVSLSMSSSAPATRGFIARYGGYEQFKLPDITIDDAYIRLLDTEENLIEGFFIEKEALKGSSNGTQNGNSRYTFTIQTKTPIPSGAKVQVVLNGGDQFEDKEEITLQDIQPIYKKTEPDLPLGGEFNPELKVNGTINDIVYTSEVSTLRFEDSIYKTSLNASTVIARIDVAGALRYGNLFEGEQTLYYDTNKIEDVNLVYISPINYSTHYNYKSVKEREKIDRVFDYYGFNQNHVLGYGAVKQDGNTLIDGRGNTIDSRWLFSATANPEYYGTSIANHLFEGDETKMYIGFFAQEYTTIQKDNNRKNIPVYRSAEASSPLKGACVYLYKDDNQNSTLVTKDPNSKILARTTLYKVKRDETTGKYIITNEPLKNEHNQAINSNDLPSKKVLRFYTIKGFGRDGSKNKYEGGVFYLIDLRNILWKDRDGNPVKLFDPEYNPGRPTPDEDSSITRANRDKSDIVEVEAIIFPM